MIKLVYNVDSSLINTLRVAKELGDLMGMEPESIKYFLNNEEKTSITVSYNKEDIDLLASQVITEDEYIERNKKR